MRKSYNTATTQFSDTFFLESGTKIIGIESERSLITCFVNTSSTSPIAISRENINNTGRLIGSGDTSGFLNTSSILF